MFRHSEVMEMDFSLPMARGTMTLQDNRLPPEEAPCCLLSPCAASSRHLVLIEHLELICRATNCSSMSGGLPAAFAVSNTWHKSVWFCCLQLPSHFSAGTF